jgi:hypothetical protein
MDWSRFLIQLTPELVALARALFKQHDGDVAAARVSIRNIRSQKASIEADRRKVDEEVARRHKEG